MCLAVPFKLLEINGKEAAADRAGIRRMIRVDLIKDPRPGEYVLVHAGFAIEKIEKMQAEESLEAAGELAAQMKEIACQIRDRQERTETAGNL